MVINGKASSLGCLHRGQCILTMPLPTWQHIGHCVGCFLLCPTAGGTGRERQSRYNLCAPTSHRGELDCLSCCSLTSNTAMQLLLDGHILGRTGKKDVMSNLPVSGTGVTHVIYSSARFSQLSY